MAHKSREKFGLPAKPPTNKNGIRCKICGNECEIPLGEKGFCGLRINEGGKIKNLGGTPDKGIVECYYDPLPTNCVASWICNENKGKNLAVFYGACSFDCLYCQNWFYREMTANLSPVMSAEELASMVDDETRCICHFGGDPSPQIMHAIEASKIVMEKKKDVRICWETNGSLARNYLEKVAEIAIESNGIIKFDLKSWNDPLHRALCGVSNERTIKNFEFLVERGLADHLTASTLLIPGYIDAIEIKNISEFISSLNPSIPYSLLAFYPQFEMDDLPTTSWKQARECLAVAKRAGLEKVRIGNVHLLR
jgi:pyruvate formate lyase activating enzyme